MWTIPNAVSVLRLLLVGVFLWLLFGLDEVAAAGWLLGVIGATDWVDGYLARRLGQVSEVGKFLDPLADRLAVVAAVIGGWIAGVLNPWFAGLLTGREVLVAVGALYLWTRGISHVEVRYLGKLATLGLYVAITLFYLGHGYDAEWMTALGWIIGVPSLVLYYYILGPYIQDARAQLADGPELSSAPTPEGDIGERS